MTLDELSRAACKPRKGKADGLDAATVRERLAVLTGWSLAGDDDRITKDFRFDDFHRTMAFVNAVAWIAHQEDHHPDMEVGYGHCRLTWSTHDVGGLSENDAICAAKVEALLAR